MNIQEVRLRNEDRLLKLKNVVGVSLARKVVNGIETDRPCIRVYVKKKQPLKEIPRRHIVPEVIDNVETDIIEKGEFVAFGYTEYMRPTKCGISIAHYKVTAGTLGALVRDKNTKEVLILSNNHVLANSGNAKIGDDILSPGPYDGGTQASLIAKLFRFVKIWHRNPWWAFWEKEQKNLVDCAVAKPLSDSDVLSEILEIGIPKGIATVKVGDKVQKTGRTTGYSKGEIIDDNVTVNVNYRTFIAKFHNQIMAGPMSAGGDSGSSVLTMDKKVIGILFAGSSQSTIINPIKTVLDMLNVDLVTG